MSEENTSGPTPETASAETVGAPVTTTEVPANFAFGTSRGTGLARGRRATKPAVTSTTANEGTYQPTAIEIVKTASEYRNPFAPVEEEKPTEPVQETAAPEPTPAPVPQPEVQASEPVAKASEPVIESRPAASPAAQEPEAKVELKILPPAEPRQTTQSWETANDSQDEVPSRKEDRPVFKPARERRENPSSQSGREKFSGQNGEGRPRQRRERRPRNNEQTSPAPKTEETNVKSPHIVAKKPSGGVFGWLKRLLGLGPVDEPAPKKEEGQGHHQRRRRGPRNNRPNGPRSQGGEGHFHRNGEQGDGQRRRRRGNRGRRGGHRPQGGDNSSS